MIYYWKIKRRHGKIWLYPYVNYITERELKKENNKLGAINVDGDDRLLDHSFVIFRIIILEQTKKQIKRGYGKVHLII